MDRGTQRAAHRPARLPGVQAAFVRSRCPSPRRGVERRGRPGHRGHHRGAHDPPRGHRDPVHALGLGRGSPTQPAPARVRAADDRRRRRHGRGRPPARDPGRGDLQGQADHLQPGQFPVQRLRDRSDHHRLGAVGATGPRGRARVADARARLDADGVPHPAPGIASPCGRAGDPAIRECKGTP